MSQNTNMTFTLVAGESSGDNLGASLIRGLRVHYPHARFAGIGGPNMMQAGFQSWVDMERLSVNGFVEPIKRLPELLRILLATRDNIASLNPACFIGIDFNFFNLLLAGMVKKRGVRTVHYVSPTVWAWRKSRIKSIKNKVDLMLTLYPFELPIYQKHGIPVEFVGHPRADEISLLEGSKGKSAARAHFNLSPDASVIAILPGSRSSEVRYSAPDFIAAAKLLKSEIGTVVFIIPAANARRGGQIQRMIQAQAPNLPITLVHGEARAAMQAADVVMVNSGTATLEAMLLKKPMVMSYRLGAITFALVSRLVDTQFFALPNILSQKPLVKELIQAEATPANLAGAVMAALNSDKQEALLDQFDKIHRTLRKNSAHCAAAAIRRLVDNDG